MDHRPLITDDRLPTPDMLTVYGGDWCGDCWTTKRFLDEQGIPYRYVDLQRDREAQAMLVAAGYRSIPVVITTAGTILIEPSTRELEQALLPGAA